MKIPVLAHIPNNKSWGAFISIRTQMAVTVSIFSFLIVVLLFFLLATITYDQLKRQKIASIEEEIQAYRLVISSQIGDFNYVAVDNLVTELVRSPNILAIQVVNEFGQEVSRSSAALPEDKSGVMESSLTDTKSRKLGVMKVWWEVPGSFINIDGIFLQALLYSFLAMLVLSFLVYQALAYSVVKPLSQLEQGLQNFFSMDELRPPSYLSREIYSLQAQSVKMKKRIVKQMEHLKHLANTDTLTDLPNRSQIEKIIQECLVLADQGEQQFSVLFFDIDHFKQINDVHGHDVGDQALQTFANMVRSCIDDELGVLGRFGGDEFVLVAFDSDRVKKLVSAIYKQLDREFILGGKRLYLSTSIGVANWPEGGENHETLLKSADVALYKSKQSGRNQATFFSHQMQLEVNRWAENMDTLKTAMKQNQFSCYCQAITNADGEIEWYELMIRLVAEDGRILTAEEFLPSAEEGGLMGEVAAFTCNACLGLLESGQFNGKISINFSQSQLLLPRLERILKPLIPWKQQIIIEVTEESFMGKKETKAVLSSLRDQGFTIALDDFGSGYSSLAMLLELPVDIVKLDKEFQTNIHRQDEARTMLTGIIEMLHALGKSVVAEGIQSASQYDFARAARCDFMQGFYLHRPEQTDLTSFDRTDFPVAMLDKQA